MFVSMAVLILQSQSSDPRYLDGVGVGPGVGSEVDGPRVGVGVGAEIDGAGVGLGVRHMSWGSTCTGTGTGRTALFVLFYFILF